MTSPALDDIIEGVIEDLAFGGKGILRTAARFVVFVPFTIPGELVRCRITLLKKNYAEATLIEVLQKNPDRIRPYCPYFGTCGGCQLQHMAYPLHLKYKQASVQHAVSRIYPEASISIEAAEPIWGYRRHISWTIQNSLAGYISVDNRSIIEVETCPIFLKEPHPVFKKITNLIKQLDPVDQSKVTIIKKNEDKFLLLFHFKTVPDQFLKLAEKALDANIEGISAQSSQGTHSTGSLTLSFTFKDFRFQYHPAAFVQNHPQQSAQIYQGIQAIVSKLAPRYLLDLYCGIGVSSIVSAQYAQKIDGIEWNRKAMECALKNSSENSLKHVNFISSDVEKILPTLLKNRPEAAIVNPPRTGLSPQVAQNLAASSLKDIIYISCQPATLARDLQIFKDKGFNLESGKAFDMFPQTGHVEALVHLKRL